MEAEGPESLLAIYLVQGQPGIREILSQKIEKAREGMRRKEKDLSTENRSPGRRQGLASSPSAPRVPRMNRGMLGPLALQFKELI